MVQSVDLSQPPLYETSVSVQEPEDFLGSRTSNLNSTYSRLKVGATAPQVSAEVTPGLIYRAMTGKNHGQNNKECGDSSYTMGPLPHMCVAGLK